MLKRMCGHAGIEVCDASTTHIVPVMIRDAVKCKQISDELLNEHGHYIQAINYPTVAVGEERLRITPTPLHHDAMIHTLVTDLQNVLNTHEIALRQ
jgi:5-aminolevulinate synthase